MTVFCTVQWGECWFCLLRNFIVSCSQVILLFIGLHTPASTQVFQPTHHCKCELPAIAGYSMLPTMMLDSPCMYTLACVPLSAILWLPRVPENMLTTSLVPRPSPTSVFDCLQHTKTGAKEGLGMRLVSRRTKSRSPSPTEITRWVS